MRIKILRTVGKKDTLPRGPDNPTSQELPAKPDGTMYQEGEVHEFSEDDAEKFIHSGCGEVDAMPEVDPERQRRFARRDEPKAPMLPARQQPTPTPHEAGEKK